MSRSRLSLETLMSRSRLGIIRLIYKPVVTRQVEERFTMDSFRPINAEDLLIRAANGKLHTNELQQFPNFHSDLHRLSLAAQLIFHHGIVIKQLQNESDVEQITVFGIVDVQK